MGERTLKVLSNLPRPGVHRVRMCVYMCVCVHALPTPDSPSLIQKAGILKNPQKKNRPWLLLSECARVSQDAGPSAGFLS